MHRCRIWHRGQRRRRRSAGRRRSRGIGTDNGKFYSVGYSGEYGAGGYSQGGAGGGGGLYGGSGGAASVFDQNTGGPLVAGPGGGGGSSLVPPDGSFSLSTLLPGVSISYTAAPVAPVVVGQPSGVSVTVGRDAVFTASASRVPTPSVQWQSSANGSTWTDVPGGTGVSLTVTNLGVASSGTQYRAVFTNTSGTAATHPATLTVRANVEPPPAPAPAATLTPAPKSTGTSTPAVTPARTVAAAGFSAAGAGPSVNTGGTTVGTPDAAFVPWFFGGGIAAVSAAAISALAYRRRKTS